MIIEMAGENKVRKLAFGKSGSGGIAGNLLPVIPVNSSAAVDEPHDDL
jgi:hypothetical protein